MALKVAIAAGGAAKAVFKPTLLCRPWEVSGEWTVRDSCSVHWGTSHPIKTRSGVTAL